MLRFAAVIRFSDAYLDAHSLSRPAGYRAAVLAIAQRDGDHYTLTSEAIAQLRAQFDLPSSPSHPLSPSPLHHPPPLLTRLHTFLSALRQWRRNGYALTPRALAIRRERQCRACPNWQPPAGIVPARCAICSCFTALKLNLPASRCPATPPRW